MKLAAYTDRVLQEFNIELSDLKWTGYSLPELEDIAELTALTDELQSDMISNQQEFKDDNDFDMEDLDTEILRFVGMLTSEQMKVVGGTLSRFRRKVNDLLKVTEDTGNDDKDGNCLYLLCQAYNELDPEDLDLPNGGAIVRDQDEEG